MFGTWIAPDDDVVVEPGPFLEQPDQEELRRERRDGEIEALDAQRRQAEGDADGGREEARQRDRHDQVHLGKDRDQLVAGIGADTHEGAGAERQLAGIAGQDVEAERRQRIDQHRDQQRPEDELAGRQRKDDEGEQQDDAEQPGVLPDREQRVVGGVGGLELAGGAVEHHANLSHRRASRALRAARQKRWPVGASMTIQLLTRATSIGVCRLQTLAFGLAVVGLDVETLARRMSRRCASATSG